MSNFQKVDNKKQWQGLLKAVKFKTFFHSFEWEEFLEKEYKWLKFERYIYKDKGLFSVAKYGKSGGQLISHPFCEYGGVLPLEKNFNIKYFEKDFEKEFNLDFKIKFHSAVVSAANSDLVSYWIENFDKKNSEDLWRGFRKSTKQEIEKAKKPNLAIKKCQNAQDLKIFYKLYLGKAKEHKIPAYPFSFFDFFQRNKNAEIILAKKGSNVIAGSVFLFYSGFIHYFINASIKNPNGANHLILWKEMQKYSHGNFNVFDFGGTKKGSSLCVFKKGFGGQEKPIYIFTNRAESKAKKDSPLRVVWGLLPKTAIRFLSPYFLKRKL